MLSRIRIMMMVALLLPQGALHAQPPDSSISGGRLGMGIGFLYSGEEIRTIWLNGIALDVFLGYNPWEHLGFEIGGVYAGTGITDWMKNKVGTIDQNTGATGTSETTGGDYFQLFLGPCYSSVLIPGLVGVLGGGGTYYGSRESGMSNIEGYDPRWTFGWGYYAELSLSLVSSGGGLFYGLTLRYSGLYANVNDFYYDRVYGTTGYDMIPATYVWDRRIELSLHVGFGFR